MKRNTLAVVAVMMGIVYLLSVPQAGLAQVRNRSTNQPNINNDVRLQIERAIYGYNGKGNDVTNRVRSQIRNNRVEMEINNDTMGSDPNHGAKKNIKVVYTYGSQRHTKLVNEKDWLRIP